MALLNKFLVTKKKFFKENNHFTDSKPTISSSQKCQQIFDSFKKDLIRVLLYRECDSRGRKLLYDSKTVEKVPLQYRSPCKWMPFSENCKHKKQKDEKMFVEVNSDFGYLYLKPSSDAKMLGEVIFGSVAMSFKGSTFKVHTMKMPNKIICSKVFPIHQTHCSRKPSHSQQFTDSMTSSFDTSNEYIIPQVSSCVSEMGIDAPDCVRRCEEDDSGFGGENPSSLSLLSTSSSMGSYPGSSSACITPSDSFNASTSSLTASGSLISLQRRWHRNISMSFDQLSCGQSNNKSYSLFGKSKLGLAVMIDFDGLTEEEQCNIQQFTFSNMAIFDSLLYRLETDMIKAYANKQTFVQKITEATEEIQEDIVDFYCAARISIPVWATLNNGENTDLVSQFVSEFVHLIDEFDTKSTNFFMSTLITAILTHHLSWVQTISTDSSKVDLPPYNPFWAQLSDLTGAVGSPKKVSRTLVIGKTRTIIMQFLWILTYFIRYNNIQEMAIDEKPSSQIEGFDNFNFKKASFNCSNNIPLFLPNPSQFVPFSDNKPCLYDNNGNNTFSSSKHFHRTITSFSLMEEMNCNEHIDSDDGPNKVVFLLGENEKLENVPEKVEYVKNTIKPSTLENTVTSVKSRNIVTAVSSVICLEPEVNSWQETVNLSTRYFRDYTSLRFQFQRCKSILDEYFDSPLPEDALATQDAHVLSGAKENFDQDHGYQRVRNTSGCETLKLPTKSKRVQLSLRNGKGDILVPLPKCQVSVAQSQQKTSQTGSAVLGSVQNHYSSIFILHGCLETNGWEKKLQRDLALSSQYSILDEEVSESVCIVGNSDTWEVQLVSSHTYIVDKPGSLGVRVGMSQLVANILESLVNLYKLQLTPESCLMFLEDQLHELYLRSEVLSRYLTTAPLCNMEQVTSTLGIEVNDVPLLLAIASVHTPKVTEMYGLSFR